MGKISFIWQHFDKLQNNEARCKKCLNTYKTSGNTTNLRTHLHKVHNITSISLKEQTVDDPEIARKEKCSTQVSIAQSFARVSSFASGQSSKAITDALVYCICKDNLPFSTVDGPGFQHFLSVACPLYKVPTRNTIKNKLDIKYDVLVANFKERIKNKDISLTSDIWSDLQMKSYLGITIHFLEKNKFSSGTLGVYELNQSHTSEYISSCFRKVLLDWEINQNNVLAIVTDNAANMKKAAQETFGTKKFIPCIAHTVNLIAENALTKTKNLNELIEKVRNIVKFVKNSVNVNDELRKKQMNEGIPEGKILKMVLDVKTRWNSVYYMVERFVYLYKTLATILLDKPNAPNILTSKELQDLKECRDLLHPLEDFTKKLSGEKYAVISMILPLINCVQDATMSVNTTSNIGTELKTNILDEFHKRFKDLEIFNDFPIATLLDPRFKNLHFKDPVNCYKATDKIKRMLMKLEQSIPNEQNNELEIPEEPLTKKFNLWAYHTSMASTQIEERTTPVYQELYDFLAKPVINNLDISPLDAWDVIASMYPNLHKIARQKIGIVATSVPSERLFSKAGATLSKIRNRLQGKRMSKLVFMSSLEKEDWGI